MRTALQARPKQAAPAGPSLSRAAHARHAAACAAHEDCGYRVMATTEGPSQGCGRASPRRLASSSSSSARPCTACGGGTRRRRGLRDGPCAVWSPPARRRLPVPLHLQYVLQGEMARQRASGHLCERVQRPAPGILCSYLPRSICHQRTDEVRKMP